MTPVYKKAGALALSVGVLGALVTHAAVTGCKPSEAPAPVEKERVADAPTHTATTSSASIATAPATGRPIPTAADAAPAPAPSPLGASAGLQIEDPEWLPASKAGPVFRPKKPTPNPTSAPPPQKQTGKPQ